MKLEAFVREKVRNGNPETISRYLKSIQKFRGWLGSRSLSLEAVREYETWLAARYKANSRIPMAVGVNLFLEWSGIPSEGPGSYRVRAPAKEIAANPRLIKPDEYAAILARIADPAERLAVRLLHDSILRPSDLVSLRLADLADEKELWIRKRTKKAGVLTNSLLTADTAAELREYVKSRGITDYVFEIAPGRPRHRTWPNYVLRKHGVEGISPRTFRRTGATNWGPDMASLMSQGGWADPKTILRHYRQDLTDRHMAAFEKAIGKASDREEEDPPGYA